MKYDHLHLYIPTVQGDAIAVAAACERIGTLVMGDAGFQAVQKIEPIAWACHSDECA